MTKHIKQKVIISFILVLPLCLAVSCFLYPPDIRYSSYIVPVITSDDQAYSFDEETNTIMYDIGESTIAVRYMKEAELNALFPEESLLGEYSTNPYSYGNWTDPNLGYIPNRFTVFEVSIINRDFAKMKIDPSEAILMTDLGETYHSYTTSIPAAKYGNSFENYYKTIRGQSGNEFYRYEMRLGMVRGKNYGLDEMIFRGDSYSGLVTFDPLRPEVNRVRLSFDVVYRFDAFNRPSDTMPISFNCERKIDRIEVTREMRLAELEREKVRVGLVDPRQIINNRVNDTARNARAFTTALQSISTEMEQCFISRYRRDEVDPGNLVLSFTVETDGTISSQNVIEVTGINSENFMNCILDVVREIKLDPIEDMPLVGSNIVKGPAKAVNVIYPVEFTVFIQGEE
ncbi:MAG: hypothetical protein HOC71_17575 [Candidatus Latescibacteria bacterium]|jgi:hypothetical protein|nr:hypothetical protein [Candidatus Latescibacterota bacterium]